MPFVQDSDGKTHYIPGVYQTTRVSKDGPGPLPDFMIPVMLTDGPSGTPYNVDSLLEANESTIGPFVYQGTSSAVASRFGADSNAVVAMTNAKNHGLPFAYHVNMSALTRASVIVTSTGPVNEYKLYPKLFGAPGNYIKLSIASGTDIEVTPVKHISQLVANAGTTDKRIYVRDSSWVREGMTITFGSNTVAIFTKTVDTFGTDLDSNGQVRHWIDLTAAIGTAITVADYAMALEHDELRKEVSGTLSSAQAQIDWFNNESKLLGATAQGTFTNPASVIALGTATPLREIAVWGTVVAGISPAPTPTD